MNKPLYSIITGIFNNYETLKEPLNFNSDLVDLVCITDDPNLTSDNWKVKLAPEVLLEQGDNYKYTYIKYHPFEFVNTKYCIYIDGSIQIKGDPIQLISGFINSNSDYGVATHPSRKCIYYELDAWIGFRSQSLEYKDRFLDLFSRVNYPRNYGLFMSGIIFHKNTEVNNHINKSVWRLLKYLGHAGDVCKNNQSILTYVLNTTNNYKLAVFNSDLVSSSYFQIYYHNSIDKLYFNKRKDTTYKGLLYKFDNRSILTFDN